MVQYITSKIRSIHLTDIMGQALLPNKNEFETLYRNVEKLFSCSLKLYFSARHSDFLSTHSDYVVIKTTTYVLIADTRGWHPASCPNRYEWHLLHQRYDPGGQYLYYVIALARHHICIAGVFLKKIINMFSSPRTSPLNSHILHHNIHIGYILWSAPNV